MNEEDYRTAYLKGYSQAERDNEALVKKLMKDVSDLSAERLALIDDVKLIYKAQEEAVIKGAPWTAGDDLALEGLNKAIDLIQKLIYEDANYPNADLRLEAITDIRVEVELEKVRRSQ